MFWICVDFSRAKGMFVQPYPGRGRYVVWFSYAYFAGMALRYVIWMWRRPDQRWVGGTIQKSCRPRSARARSISYGYGGGRRC